MPEQNDLKKLYRAGMGIEVLVILFQIWRGKWALIAPPLTAMVNLWVVYYITQNKQSKG
jgi:hypothetical protein